jgi:hypothetical protein
MLKEFRAPASSFWGVDRKRAEYGEWLPPFYDYIMVEKKQWLIVSDQQVCTIDGMTLTLKSYPEGCHISGMMRLEKPGTYKLHHKTFV